MSTPETWTQLIFEYWDVPEANWGWWDGYYEQNVAQLLRNLDGHSGTIITLRAGMPWREQPHKVLFPHPQMQIQPAQAIKWSTPRPAIAPLRSNVSIDLHALLQHEWTHAAMHFMVAPNPALHFEWIAAWAAANPDWPERFPESSSPEDALSEELFTRVYNHWDVTFDVSAVFSGP